MTDDSDLESVGSFKNDGDDTAHVLIVGIPPGGIVSSENTSSQSASAISFECIEKVGTLNLKKSDSSSSLSSYIAVPNRNSSNASLSEGSSGSLISNFELVSIASDKTVLNCKRCRRKHPLGTKICHVCHLALCANPCQDVDEEIALALQKQDEVSACNATDHYEMKPSSSRRPTEGGSSTSNRVVYMDDINPLIGSSNQFIPGSPSPGSSSGSVGFMGRGICMPSGSTHNSEDSQRNDSDCKLRIKHNQQRLLLLHHSSKCKFPEGKCPITPHCADMKRLWVHMSKCSNTNCRVPHCYSSRSILSHYRKVGRDIALLSFSKSIDTVEILSGKRYTCNTCTDFDLCEELDTDAEMQSLFSYMSLDQNQTSATTGVQNNFITTPSANDISQHYPSSFSFTPPPTPSPTRSHCGVTNVIHGQTIIDEGSGCRTDLDPLKRFEDIKGSVVLVGLIDMKKRLILNLGTGFIADNRRGFIITAAHIFYNLEDGEKVEPLWEHNTTAIIGTIGKGNTASFAYTAQIRAKDEKNVDAVVLGIRTKFEKPIQCTSLCFEPQVDNPIQWGKFKREKMEKLNITTIAHTEEQIRIIGYDQSGQGLHKARQFINNTLRLTKGYVSQSNRTVSRIRDVEDGNSVLIVECTVNRGQNGGPCINQDGEVIGILSRKVPRDTQTCYLVPSNELKKLLRKARRLSSLK